MNSSLLGVHAHYNIFLITADDFRACAAQIEQQYALDGVRVKCISVFDNERSKNIQNYDFDIRMALVSTLAKNCDGIVVAGSRVSAEIVKYIEIAAKSRNKIYATDSMKRLLVADNTKNSVNDIVFEKNLLDVLK